MAKLSKKQLRRIAIKMLEDAYQEQIQHLELRLIRDTQAPRFEKLKKSHPKIWEDFTTARTGPHEFLKVVREERMGLLLRMAEGKFEELGLEKPKKTKK